jgi:hypothetical protein
MTIGVEPTHERSRVPSHYFEQSVGRGQDARHSAERQPSRAERHDLLVIRATVASNHLDRVGRRIGVVERLIEAIERSLQRR